jgi:hypothetical protein
MVFIRLLCFENSFGLRIVPEFLVATSLLEPAEVCRTELKPFLTIFGTRMHAFFSVMRPLLLLHP